MSTKISDREWFEESHPSQPLYEQISLRIGDLIGGLVSGTRLPSQNALAKELKVSKMTIRKAVKECNRRGWIYNEGHKLFAGSVSGPGSKDLVSLGEQSHRLLSIADRRGRNHANGPETNESGDQSFAISKWQNIFQELEKRVLELPNGARLESESTLAKEFSVSRLTARKAVTELKRKGRVYTDGLRTFVGRHGDASSRVFALSEDRFENLIRLTDRPGRNDSNSPESDDSGDRSFGIYKWQNVFQELEKRVSELPSGARLESESTLAKEFSVSRLTARKAVTELKKRGQVYAEGNKTFVGYLTSDDPRFISRRTLASRSIPEDGLSKAKPGFELALLERFLESMIRNIEPQLGDRCPHCRNYEYSEERSNDERSVWCSFCGKSRIYVCEGCGEKDRIRAARIQFCRFCGEKRTPNASESKGSDKAQLYVNI